MWFSCALVLLALFPFALGLMKCTYAVGVASLLVSFCWFFLFHYVLFHISCLFLFCFVLFCFVFLRYYFLFFVVPVASPAAKNTLQEMIYDRDPMVGARQ